jgi:hypothetical protein
MPELVKIQGTVHAILDTSRDNFQKRDVVLVIDEDADPTLYNALEVVYEMVGVVEAMNLKTGDAVVAHVEIRGREWMPPNGGPPRYFNSLSLKKLQTLADSDTFADEAKSENTEEAENDLGDEMPF